MPGTPGLIRILRNKFVAGLIIAVPIVITVQALRWLFAFIGRDFGAHKVGEVGPYVALEGHAGAETGKAAGFCIAYVALVVDAHVTGHAPIFFLHGGKIVVVADVGDDGLFDFERRHQKI